MRCILRRIPFDSRADIFSIYPLGDTHVGHRGSREDAFAVYADRIEADPLARWVGMGDYLDCVQRSDKRYDVRETAEWMTLADQEDIVAAQRDHWLMMTRHIWSKCLGLLKGNHEDAIRRHYERDVYAELLRAVAEDNLWCEQMDGLGRKTGAELALGYVGQLWLQFARSNGSVTSIDSWWHHGYGGGRLKGAKALALQRAAGQFDVRLLVMGHTHDEVIEPINRIKRTVRGRLWNQRTMTMVSGTFLETYSTEGAAYIERAGYPPGSIGTSYALVRPGMDLDAPLYERELVQVVS